MRLSPLLAALSVAAMPALAADIAVTGIYLERIATPPGSTFSVALQDVSRADAPAVARARAEATVAGGPPFRVVLTDDPQTRDPQGRYALRAELRLPDGALFFTTDSFVEAPGENAEVEIRMIRTGGAPAEPVSLKPWDLIGPRWALAQIGHLPAPADSKAHLLFDDAGRIAGDAGCNRLGASYLARPDGAFLAGPGMSTMMACPEPAMSTERAVFDALDRARGWRLGDDRMTLLDGDGAVLLVFARAEP
ncbi:MAG: META domain-containing protein [Rubrimonas sp.]|uniref:META domain-containing protein n=1 Tax=Rubrimonas sp. TaxID=2036015 RepID=UPI002FDCF827